MYCKPVVTVVPDDSLATVAGLMARHHIGAVVVTASRKPVGIITDRDLALALGSRKATPDDAVQRVMNCPVITVREDEGIFNATQKMARHSIRRLPVVDYGDGLTGMVTADDLSLLLGRELSSLAEAIAPEVSAAR
jgi:CBS domain-containing protein